MVPDDVVPERDGELNMEKKLAHVVGTIVSYILLGCVTSLAIALTIKFIMTIFK